jgi:hypothetical protein
MSRRTSKWALWRRNNRPRRATARVYRLPDQPDARIARIVDLPIARDVIERQDVGWCTMLLAPTIRTVGAAAQDSQARGRLAPSSNIMKGSGLGQCRGLDAAQGGGTLLYRGSSVHMHRDSVRVRLLRGLTLRPEYGRQ